MKIRHSMEGSQVNEEKELLINETTRECLREIAKITYTMSIFGFVLMIINIYRNLASFYRQFTFDAVTIDDIQMKDSSLIIWFLSLIPVIIAFFPLYFLCRFSLSLKKAIKGNSSNLLPSSMKYLGLHFKSMILIILLVFLAKTLYFI